MLLSYVWLWLVFFHFQNVMCSQKVKESLEKKYEPDWDSLDSRPLPEWYDRSKIGIFLHWGVYSVPSFGQNGAEWFWKFMREGGEKIAAFMRKNYPPNFTYQEFAPMFTAEFFNPNQWADLFKRSGAKYVVLTSKHHDGFTLFPSKRSLTWSSAEIGPQRDLVGDLSKAVKAKGLNFGVYYSLYEWYNLLYLEDKNNVFATRNYTETQVLPDLKQLVTNYHPSVIWTDGDWQAKDSYWKSTDFLAWLYNKSPVKEEVVVNDRWGQGTECEHGDFFSCGDRYSPGTLQDHKWENAFTLDKRSWGYRRDMELNDVMTMEELLKQIVGTVSCGGNALINVGPTKDGVIPHIFQERLTSLGEWLDINGPGLYGTSPWQTQNDTRNSNVWYTCTKQGYNGRNPTDLPRKRDKLTAIYTIVLEWPHNNVLEVNELAPILQHNHYKLKMLDPDDIFLRWNISNGVALIQFPDKAQVKSEYAWTLKLSLED